MLPPNLKLGWLTRAVTHAKAILSKAETPVRGLREQTDLLKIRWAKYEEAYALLEDVMLDAGEDISSGSDAHGLRESEVDNIRLNLEIAIQNATFAPPPLSNPTATQTPRFKMPDVRLSEFEGDPESWPAFWDTFSSLVHKKPNFDPIVKFTFLRQALRGKAADAIKGFTTTEANYHEAIQTLKDNFADEKKLQRHLIRRWLHLKAPKFEENELSKFKIEYETTLRAISNYHQVTDSEWQNKEHILDLLPVEVTEYIYNRLKTQYPSLQEISESLQTLIDFLSQRKPKAQKEESSSYSPPRAQVSTKSVNHYSSQPKMTKQIGAYNNTVAPNKCLFCQKTDYFSSNCLYYRTTKAGRDRMAELQKCTRCTSANHDRSVCQAQFRPCRFCGMDNHHGFFCYKSAMATNKSTSPVTNAPGTVAQVTH